jgi:transposase
MRVAKPIQLSPADDRRLRILSKRQHVEARAQLRARIVLLAADGMSHRTIAANLEIERRIVARWRARFLAEGADGLLQDATRRGRPRTAREAARVEQVVRPTLEQTPTGGTLWSRRTRTLAAHLGISSSSVGRIWREHGPKLRRVESFKISSDPQFVEKLEDIVGLYLRRRSD